MSFFSSFDNYATPPAGDPSSSSSSPSPEVQPNSPSPISASSLSESSGGHAPEPSPREPTTYQKLMNDASSHMETLQRRRVLVEKSQTAHAALWKLREEPRQVEGSCACHNEVVSTFVSQICELDYAAAPSAAEAFRELLSWSFGPVFTTLLRQTYLQYQYASEIIAQVKDITESSDRSFVTGLNDLRELHKPLTEILCRHDIPPKLAETIRSLLIFSCVSFQSQAESEEEQKTFSQYMLEVLARTHGFSWGVAILNLPLDTLVSTRTLSSTVKSLVKAEVHEEEFLAFLKQIKWIPLESIQADSSESSETLQRELINPLKKVIKYGATNSYLSLLQLAQHLLLWYAMQYPQLTSDLVLEVVGGPWPSVVLCSQAFPSLHLKGLSEEKLNELFCSSFCLQSVNLTAYAKLSTEEKRAHRQAYFGAVIGFVLPNKNQQESFSPSEAILQLWISILRQSQDALLQKTIIEELFCAAFVTLPFSPEANQWIHTEAQRSLNKLLATFPALLSLLVFIIGQYSQSVDCNPLLGFLSPSLFASYTIDAHSLNVLCYLLCGMSLPPAVTKHPADSLPFVQNLLSFLVEQSSHTIPSRSENQQRIGARLLEVFPWYQTKGVYRTACAILISASASTMPPQWAVRTLLGPRGYQLLICSPWNHTHQAIIEAELLGSSKVLQILQLICVLRGYSEPDVEQEIALSWFSPEARFVQQLERLFLQSEADIVPLASFMLFVDSCKINPSLGVEWNKLLHKVLSTYPSRKDEVLYELQVGLINLSTDKSPNFRTSPDLCFFSLLLLGGPERLGPA